MATIAEQRIADLAGVFYDTSRGFAVSAIKGADSFPVIFNNDHYGSTGFDVTVNQTAPMMRVSAANIAAYSVGVGDTITIGGVDYVIVEAMPQDQGETDYRLHLAA